jgi:hypothetical protein
VSSRYRRRVDAACVSATCYLAHDHLVEVEHFGARSQGPVEDAALEGVHGRRRDSINRGGELAG